MIGLIISALIIYASVSFIYFSNTYGTDAQYPFATYRIQVEKKAISGGYKYVIYARSFPFFGWFYCENGGNSSNQYRWADADRSDFKNKSERFSRSVYDTKEEAKEAIERLKNETVEAMYSDGVGFLGKTVPNAAKWAFEKIKEIVL